MTTRHKEQWSAASVGVGVLLMAIAVVTFVMTWDPFPCGVFTLPGLSTRSCREVSTVGPELAAAMGTVGGLCVLGGVIVLVALYVSRRPRYVRSSELAIFGGVATMLLTIVLTFVAIAAYKPGLDEQPSSLNWGTLSTLANWVFAAGGAAALVGAIGVLFVGRTPRGHALTPAEAR